MVIGFEMVYSYTYENLLKLYYKAIIKMMIRKNILRGHT
jgi:hypothetical protein